MTIKASDGNNADTLVLTVTVTDENEPPVVTGNSLIDYPENGADPVATYTAPDPEGTSDYLVPVGKRLRRLLHQHRGGAYL